RLPVGKRGENDLLGDQDRNRRRDRAQDRQHEYVALFRLAGEPVRIREGRAQVAEANSDARDLVGDRSEGRSVDVRSGHVLIPIQVRARSSWAVASSAGKNDSIAS